MVLVVGGVLDAEPGRPRVRGDGPPPYTHSVWAWVSAPRTRGWSGAPNDHHRHRHVGPAYAGMVRCRIGMGIWPWWSAPRTRGWSLRRRNRRHSSSVGPAYAGMVRHTMTTTTYIRSRPRVRGDGPVETGQASPSAGSAPRTRGWSRIDHPHRARHMVGPAYAGMVHPGPRFAGCEPGRPRVRGDGPSSWLLSVRAARSAPRTRGWSCVVTGGHAAFDVGPAYAGMVRPRTPGDRCACRRPRVRGDGPELHALWAEDDASAPRTRGWS